MNEWTNRHCLQCSDCSLQPWIYWHSMQTLRSYRTVWVDVDSEAVLALHAQYVYTFLCCSVYPTVLLFTVDFCRHSLRDCFTCWLVVCCVHCSVMLQLMVINWRSVMFSSCITAANANELCRVGLVCSVRFVGGGARSWLTPHWLRTTPLLVTVKFGLVDRIRPPQKGQKSKFVVKSLMSDPSPKNSFCNDL